MMKTPDELDSQFAYRAFAVIAASILLKTGYGIHKLLVPLGSVVQTSIQIIVYLTSFLLLLTAVFNVDYRRWARPLTTLVFGVLLSVLGIAYLTKTQDSFFGTDAMLFSRYSIDLLLSGKNPYAHSMQPAFEQYNVAEQFVTYRIDGSVVTSLSYPALSFLAFLPQALLGIPNLNLTTVVVFLTTFAFLFHETPPKYSFAAVVVLFTDPSILIFSFGGVFDMLWVLPLLFTMRFWYQERFRAAAILAGLTFAVKQTPWFIAPFLAVWLYHYAETRDEFLHNARTTLTYGFAAFLAPNLPFILMDPMDWAEGVLTPVAGSGAPLVKQGVGLTLISVGNLYAVPKTVYSLMMALSILTLLVVYVLYFDTVKDGLWLVPMVPLFFNYRSLQNYFIFFVPVAYYTLVLRYKALNDDFEDRRFRSMKRRKSSLPNPANISVRRRHFITAGVILLSTSAIIGAGAAMHTDTKLDVSMTVVGNNDPGEINTITEFEVKVTNHEDQPIQPAFNLIHSGQQTHAYWEIESGPKTLNPGETAVYTISSPTALIGAPYGSNIILGVNDRGTEVGAKIGPFKVQAPTYDSVENPEFSLWGTKYGMGMETPFRWSVTPSPREADRVTLEEADAGLFLESKPPSRSSGPWSMIGVQQTVAFPDTLTINATPKSVVSGTPKHPRNPAGVELIDRDYRIWVLFSDVDEPTVVHRSSGKLSYTILYVPAEPGEQVTTTINITRLYEGRGWVLPKKTATEFSGETIERRTLSLHPFAATYPGDGNATASIIVHSIKTEPMADSLYSGNESESDSGEDN